MCSARYWRAGVSQPSRTSGSDFSIYIYIYIFIAWLQVVAIVCDNTINLLQP